MWWLLLVALVEMWWETGRRGFSSLSPGLHAAKQNGQERAFGECSPKNRGTNRHGNSKHVLCSNRENSPQCPSGTAGRGPEPPRLPGPLHGGSSALQGPILPAKWHQPPLRLANKLVSDTFSIRESLPCNSLCNISHPLYEKKPAYIFHWRYQQQHFRVPLGVIWVFGR